MLEQKHLYQDKERVKKSGKALKFASVCFEIYVLQNRVRKYGDPNVRPRPLKVRIAAAKEK